MDFVCVDVETANADLSSICQIGFAEYRAGELFRESSFLVDPKTNFDPWNVSVHGIEECDVQGMQTFRDISGDLSQIFAGSVVVTHSHFDRTALTRAFENIGASMPDCQWLDTAKVARRTWSQFSSKGFGLKNVCSHLGYAFQHHDALEDAKAAAQILLAANELQPLGIDGWLKRINQPISKTASSYSVAKQGNPEGILFGDVIVFTGALSITRQTASTLAAGCGLDVHNSVTKKTTILCVGDQDISVLNGHSKSGKHRKAELYQQKGQAIRIIKESDFLAMTESNLV